MKEHQNLITATNIYACIVNVNKLKRALEESPEGFIERLTSLLPDTGEDLIKADLEEVAEAYISDPCKEHLQNLMEFIMEIDHVIIFDKVALETTELNKLAQYAADTFLDDDYPRETELSTSRVNQQMKGNEAAIKAATAAFEKSLREKFM
jgi:predicted house-cleaning noncanonical NTP pyrophosphatase (MazG superfamily)